MMDIFKIKLCAKKIALYFCSEVFKFRMSPWVLYVSFCINLICWGFFINRDYLFECSWIINVILIFSFIPFYNEIYWNIFRKWFLKVFLRVTDKISTKIWYSYCFGTRCWIIFYIFLWFLLNTFLFILKLIWWSKI